MTTRTDGETFVIEATSDHEYYPADWKRIPDVYPCGQKTPTD
jgi:hypothetical protein